MLTISEALSKLMEWRKIQAQREGIELFRVLSTRAIQEIARQLPKSREELLLVKGIKAKKFAKYGIEVLEILHGKTGLFKIQDQPAVVEEDSILEESQKEESKDSVYTVSEYLDVLNHGLKKLEARVRGEVSSLDIRDRYLFFGIKDKRDGSLINCFMWQSAYAMSGVAIEEGMEIIVSGYPEMYKPSGRLSFRTSVVELAGEGALKKAYEELKRKLEAEGLFDLARKRQFPEYPCKIGLITSRTGAVIHDFLNNLGKFGFQILFHDSKVEGQRAVPELMRAVRFFRNKNIDTLVIIRGGGSLESLLAFNNEALVREIAKFPRPVICGIGHDKNVPLASLAADVAVSTPSMVTRALGASWEQALGKVRVYERELFSTYREALFYQKFFVQESAVRIRANFENIFQRIRALGSALKEALVGIGHRIHTTEKDIAEAVPSLMRSMQRGVLAAHERIRVIDKHISAVNPERQLRIGYSIARVRGRIVRGVHGLSPGEELDIEVSDGEIYSEIKIIKRQK